MAKRSLERAELASSSRSDDLENLEELDGLPEDEATLAWASVNVAHGIEDDTLYPEGHVQL